MVVGHGSTKLHDPLTGRSAAVKDAADRLSASLTLAKGDHTAALPSLTAIVDSHPSAHWAHADLGWCRFHLGQLEVRDEEVMAQPCWGRKCCCAVLLGMILLACSYLSTLGLSSLSARQDTERCCTGHHAVRPIPAALAHAQPDYSLDLNDCMGLTTTLLTMPSQEARESLQTAIKLPTATAAEATAAELAQHKYRLGRVLWALGGRLRTERGGAHALFLAAAGVYNLTQVKLMSSCRESHEVYVEILHGHSAVKWSVQAVSLRVT